MITLECGKKKWKVSLERAEAVLRNPLNKITGWKLPVTHELTKDGRIKRIKATDKGKAQEEGVKSSDNTRAEAKVSHRDSTAKE